MEINYNLYKLENALTFQVSHQSSAFTKYLRANRQFVASNGWKVKTNEHPGIDMESSTVYIQGFNYMLDTKPSVIFGITNKYRDELVAEIYSALQELTREAIAKDPNHIQYSNLPQSAFTPVRYDNRSSSIEYYSL